MDRLGLSGTIICSSFEQIISGLGQLFAKTFNVRLIRFGIHTLYYLIITYKNVTQIIDIFDQDDIVSLFFEFATDLELMVINVLA